MGKIVFFILCMFLVFPLSAQVVDFNLAKERAQTFFFVNEGSGSLLKSATEVKVDSCTTFFIKNGMEKSGKTESEPALYVINRKDKSGFIVISAEHRTPAFLSYSLDDTFHKDSIPPAYEDWLNIYVEQIEYLKENSLAIDNFANSEWNNSIDLEFQQRLKSANATVSPLLDIEGINWSQSSPYNLKCPEYSSGNRTPVGCTAVAMGQIMRYWKYPSASNEIPGYQDWDNLDDDDNVIPGSNYGYIAGSNKTVYNWDNIPNQAFNTSTETEKDAISEFLYNVAVSVQMNFGPKGSSAGFSTTSFIDYFKYSESVEIITRYSGYSYRYIPTSSEWINILKDEIKNGRPVLYAGMGSGSHAFVCDGYDFNDRFHFNWGWGGYGNCHCSLYYLWPDNDYRVGDYSDRQYAMVGITPPNVPSLSVQPSSLTFGKVTVDTNSEPQSFTLNGNKLTSNILITAPIGFEVSRYSGSEYGSSLSITPSNGIISNATIYVRFSPTELETKSGEILISSSGLFPRNISVSGTGIGEAPQNLVASAGDGSVTLSWTAPTSFSPSSYTVYWSSTENGTYSKVSTTSNTTMGMTASNGNIYWFYVVANYSNGASNPSIKVSAKPGSISPPTITVSGSSLYDFGSVVVNSTSTSQSFTVSGSNLTNDISLTAPAGFEISRSSGSDYKSCLSLTQSGGTVSSTTIYVRFKPTSTGLKSGNIAITSTGAETKNVAVSGTGTSLPPPPAITVSTTSLPDFGSVQVNSNSTAQSFTVSGSNLTNDISLTAPTGFEISRSSGSDYKSSLSLAQSGGTVASTTIYVRFKPTSTGLKSGNIAITSTGAETKNVAVSGTGTAVATPSIAVSTNTLSDFGNVVVNTTSAAQSFTVSGSNLTANISLTAPTGFEISKSSGSGYGSSLSLTQSGGTVSSTTIYVRFSPTTRGTKSGNIGITSTDAATKNVAVSGTGIDTCTPPVSPTSATASQTTITSGQSTTLQVNGGVLNSAPEWVWFTDACGVNKVGTGTTLTISPSKTTTYYVQAKACDDSTACRFVTITVTGENPNPDDFYIQIADATPNVIKTGGKIDVNCTQCYSGSKSDVNMGSSYIGYFLSKDVSFSSSSDTELGTDSSGLGSDDQCNSEGATLTIPSGTPAGTYYILFVADYDGRFSESNESNNVFIVKITVTQTGNCNLSLSKSSLDFTSSSGNSTVNVTSNSSWTVSDDASWITVSPVSGSNNRTLTVSVSANSGTQRSGTVTVTGCDTTKTININQTGNQTVIDADGNVYSPIAIGNQLWLGQNLKTTKYNDGTSIQLVTSSSTWSNLSGPAYCWYNNDISNKNPYGALYNWYAVNTGKLCPVGWHVPTYYEWENLENYLITNGYNYDGSTSENKIAKSLASNDGWLNSLNVGSPGNTDYSSKTNTSNFSALAAGGRSGNGSYDLMGYKGGWWSSTPFFNDKDYVWGYDIYYYNDFTSNGGYWKTLGISVRCICDLTVDSKILPTTDLIKIYPNPASKEISVESFNSTITSCTIEIYNMEGKKVKTRNNVDLTHKQIVNTSDLISGFYFVRIYSDKVNISQKIIIKQE